MPLSLKQLQTGPEPASARKIREYLTKHVKPEAPYFSNEEMVKAVNISDGTIRGCAREHLEDWFKRVGRIVWWSTPEHIKKL